MHGNCDITHLSQQQQQQQCSKEMGVCGQKVGQKNTYTVVIKEISPRLHGTSPPVNVSTSFASTPECLSSSSLGDLPVDVSPPSVRLSSAATPESRPSFALHRIENLADGVDPLLRVTTICASMPGTRSTFSSSEPSPAADNHIPVCGVPERAHAVPLVLLLAVFLEGDLRPVLCDFVYKVRMFLSSAKLLLIVQSIFRNRQQRRLACLVCSDHLTKLVLCPHQCRSNRVQLADVDNTVEYTRNYRKCSTHVALKKIMILCSPLFVA